MEKQAGVKVKDRREQTGCFGQEIDFVEVVWYDKRE